MAHMVFWPTMVVTLFLMVFGGQVLGLFGSEFMAAQWCLTILVLGQLINATTGPGGYLLDLTGHQDRSARVRCGSAVLNLSLNYLLIPKFGIMGAAIATTTTTILDNIIIYILTVKYLGIHASIFSSLKPPNLQPK